MRYRMLEQGPDDRSTCMECWGSTATSDGRLIMEAARLVDLIPRADQMRHGNWGVRDTHRREWVDARDFRKRPTVAAFREKAAAE